MGLMAAPLASRAPRPRSFGGPSLFQSRCSRQADRTFQQFQDSPLLERKRRARKRKMCPLVCAQRFTPPAALRHKSLGAGLHFPDQIGYWIYSFFSNKKRNAKPALSNSIHGYSSRARELNQPNSCAFAAWVRPNRTSNPPIRMELKLSL